MIKTLSSITPSPLNGWFGSTLQCCTCNHTSPIQNSPFLEIPIVPTSLSHFQKSLSSPSSSYYSSSSSPLSPLPACSLDDCLADFTTVEKVQDVDCRACAIKAELKNLDEEGCMLRGAIRNIASRRKTALKQKHRNGHSNGHHREDVTNVHDDNNTNDGNEMKNGDVPAQALRTDLKRIESRIQYLEGLDPDDGDIVLERNGHDDDLLLRYCYSPPFTKDGEEKKCDNSSDIRGQGRNSNGQSSSSSISKIPKAHRGDANKRLLLTRLPPILCLHAKRLFYDPNTDRNAKAMQHITFPEFLDLSAHCAYSGGCRGVVGGGGIEDTVNRGSPVGIGNAKNNASTTADRKPIMYRLMSVIEHRGNAYAGHYLTYRRITEHNNSDNTKDLTLKHCNDEPSSSVNEWAMASDEKVSFVSWKEVSQCQAYMLFYEAI